MIKIMIIMLLIVSATAMGYECDGRQYCSRMTWREESLWVLNNCPDTKLDGDNDGIPCEKQWCTSNSINWSNKQAPLQKHPVDLISQLKQVQ